MLWSFGCVVTGALSVVRRRCIQSRQRSRSLVFSNASSRIAVSRRVQGTDAPCIVGMQVMLKDAPEPPISLAQGIVHWLPPEAALSAAQEAILLPQTSAYGADEGDNNLRSTLKEKLARENGLVESEVMVTAGANQAYTNLVLTLLDAGDVALLFKPYYFNHLMALQMVGSGDTQREIRFGSVDPSTMQPDMEDLERQLRQGAESGRPVRMVTITSPCNPTGVVVPRATLKLAADLCRHFGAWLCLDNTYEYFTFGDHEHACLEDPHVVNVFSFSKAYGMMGWRVGYLAYPAALSAQLLKVQDTVPICPTRISQVVAMGACAAGREWVQKRVRGLGSNLRHMKAALEPLGPRSVTGGEGAIYLMCRLPPAFASADRDVVKWLAFRHGVCLIPGSACGAPGCVRVCFANLPTESFLEACRRLRVGLEELVQMPAGADLSC